MKKKEKLVAKNRPSCCLAANVIHQKGHAKVIERVSIPCVVMSQSMESLCYSPVSTFL